MRTWYLPAVLFFFSLLSVLVLASITPALASKQLFFFLLGSVLFYLMSTISFSTLTRFHWVLYAGVCGLLGYVLLIGELTRNTARWISIGESFNIQPSQLAIPLVGLTISSYLANQVASRSRNTLQSLIIFLAIVALPAVLILVEPDLGSTLMFLVCLGLVLVLHPAVGWKLIGGLSLGAVVVGVFAWVFVLQPYQKERVFSFSGQERDYAGSGYNARQALIAVGSGGVFGTGLGRGVQSHLRFLPERQTDFIFASFAEEFGFFGSALLVGLYASLVAFCIKISHDTTSAAAKFYCYIIAFMIAFQSGVNIGMNIGLVPITGITLPLMSYGGSSLLTIAGSLGILQSIAKETTKKTTLHIS